MGIGQDAERNAWGVGPSVRDAHGKRGRGPSGGGLPAGFGPRGGPQWIPFPVGTTARSAPSDTGFRTQPSGFAA